METWIIGRVHVALDETVIQLNDEQWWLYAAVDPKTNRILHVRLFPTRSVPVMKKFLQGLCEKHNVENAVFLVHRGPWLRAALHRYNLRFSTSPSEIGIRPNVSFVRSNDERDRSEILSATSIRKQPNRGYKRSLPMKTSLSKHHPDR